MLDRRTALALLGASLGTALDAPGGRRGWPRRAEAQPPAPAQVQPSMETGVPSKGSAATPAPSGPPPLQRGMALGLFHEDPLWSYAGLLREIKELGTTHVSLTLPYYQEHGGSTAIYTHPRFSAPDQTIVRTVRAAHALGLSVMLFPIVRLASPRSFSEWRGTLKPQEPATWWQSYERLLVHVAELGAREKVALLCVGSELSTLDQAAERPRWQALLGAIRKVYRGLLTYSGNWDHYQQVGIYDLCDLPGLCAYFPLAGRADPAPAPLTKLTAAWQKRRDELVAFSASLGKPLLLTEVGYLSQRGAAAFPWEEGAQGPVDLEEQRRCYQAFAATWAGCPALRGVYFWNYYGWGGRVSRGYTPRHKPAAEEIERYFLGEAARPAR